MVYAIITPKAPKIGENLDYSCYRRKTKQLLLMLDLLLVFVILYFHFNKICNYKSCCWSMLYLKFERCIIDVKFHFD